MIFIIAGHMGNDIINRFVFTFHVPLFFLLSGYFYSYKEGTLGKKFLRYIKPYSFTVTALLCLGVFKEAIKIEVGKASPYDLYHTVAHWIIAGIYGSGYRTDFLQWHIPAIGAIWFLLALIWAIVIMQTMNKWKLALWKQEIIVMFLFAVSQISKTTTWLPFSIQSGFSALLFVFIGYEIKRRNVNVFDKREMLLMSFVLWGWGLYYSYEERLMSIVESLFPNALYNIIGACAASYLIVWLCRKIKHCEHITPFLIVFGKYSAIVLCFHLIEMSFVPWKAAINPIIKCQMVSLPVILMCKIVFCYLAILLVRSNKYLRSVFGLQ